MTLRSEHVSLNQTNLNLSLVKHFENWVSLLLLSVAYTFRHYTQNLKLYMAVQHTHTHTLTLSLSLTLLAYRAGTPNSRAITYNFYFLYLSLYSVRVRAVERDKRDSVIIKEEGVEITKHNNYQIGPISSQYFYLGTTRSLLKPPFSQSRCECIFMRTKSFIEIDIDVGA